MGSTVIGGITYPEGVDQPDIAADLRRAFEESARLGLPRFANTIERDAAFTTLGISPSEGMAYVQLDVDQALMYNGTAWVTVVNYGNPPNWSPILWTASAGAPAINDGSLTGEYQEVGKWVDAKFDLVAGPGTNFGTAGAFWRFQLPVGTVSGIWSGGCFAVDTAALEYPLTWVIGYDSNNFITLFKPGANGRATNTSPFTFGNGDKLSVGVRYRRAT